MYIYIYIIIYIYTNIIIYIYTNIIYLIYRYIIYIKIWSQNDLVPLSKSVCIHMCIHTYEIFVFNTPWNPPDMSCGTQVYGEVEMWNDTQWQIRRLEHQFYWFPCTQVSWNRGTPRSSILVGFPIVNRPFWGTPIPGNPHIGFQIIPNDGHIFRLAQPPEHRPDRCEKTAFSITSLGLAPSLGTWSLWYLCVVHSILETLDERMIYIYIFIYIYIHTYNIYIYTYIQYIYIYMCICFFKLWNCSFLSLFMYLTVPQWSRISAGRLHK